MVRTQAPDTINNILNGPLNAGVELPSIDVLRQDFEGRLLEGVRYELMVGESVLGRHGYRSSRLPTTNDIDWQMWIARNGQPRNILITTRYDLGDPQHQIIMNWKPHR